MTTQQTNELAEALERIEREKDDPGFYLHYTDVKIDLMSKAIE